MIPTVTNLFKPTFAARILGIFLVSFCLSCSGDDSDGNIDGGCVNNFNWFTAVSDEATAFTNAAVAYSNDPTAANCAAYETTALAYIDALEDAFDCVSAANRSELQAAADEARADIEAGLCN